MPGVLGPHLCRAQGVVAQAANDFAFSAVPPTAVLAGVTSGVVGLLMAPHIHKIGTRRVALLASVLFPAGMFALPAAAVALNSWPAFASSAALVGGVGFYCIYQQIPPLLSARWFPDRKGLAVSLYFTSFGSALLLYTPVIERLLAAFRVAYDAAAPLTLRLSLDASY
jgi:MFS family permease